MGFFHVFKIVQKVPNRAKHHIFFFSDAYEHHALENVSGSLIRSCDCQLIILMDVVPGHLELSTTQICFFDHKGDNDGELNYDFRYPLDELIEIFSRRHNLRKTAMEFFLLDRSSFFVNFPTQQVFPYDLFRKK